MRLKTAPMKDKDDDEHVCTFDPLCGILLELFSGLMGADCRDDVHASVYLTDEFAMDTDTHRHSHDHLMHKCRVLAEVCVCTHTQSQTVLCVMIF